MQCMDNAAKSNEAAGSCCAKRSTIGRHIIKIAQRIVRPAGRIR